MKKLFLACVCCAALGTGLQAQISGGLAFDMTWLSTSVSGNFYNDSSENQAAQDLIKSMFDKDGMTNFGFNFYFDMKWLVLTIGGSTLTYSYDYFFPGNDDEWYYVNIDNSDSFFTMGFKFKYPVLRYGRFSFFPSMGFDWFFFQKMKLKTAAGSETVSRNDLTNDEYYDRFVFTLGGGADFFVSDRIYIRAGVDWAIFTNNDEQSEYVDNFAESIKMNIFQHGLKVTLGLGYKLLDY